jgi:hypothetical protein
VFSVLSIVLYIACYGDVGCREASLVDHPPSSSAFMAGYKMIFTFFVTFSQKYGSDKIKEKDIGWT